jgi:hypothetical protein
MRMVSALVARLLISEVAAWQRDYFEGNDNPGCERASTVAETSSRGRSTASE